MSEIFIKDENGNSIDFIAENWEDNDLILYRYDIFLISLNEIPNDIDINLFPNPTQGHLRIEMDLKIASDIQIEIIDKSGKFIKKIAFDERVLGNRTMHIDLNEFYTKNDIYLCEIMAGKNGTVVRKIFLKD